MGAKMAGSVSEACEMQGGIPGPGVRDDTAPVITFDKRGCGPVLRKHPALENRIRQAIVGQMAHGLFKSKFATTTRWQGSPVWECRVNEKSVGSVRVAFTVGERRAGRDRRGNSGPRTARRNTPDVVAGFGEAGWDTSDGVASQKRPPGRIWDDSASGLSHPDSPDPPRPSTAVTVLYISPELQKRAFTAELERFLERGRR